MQPVSNPFAAGRGAPPKVVQGPFGAPAPSGQAQYPGPPQQSQGQWSQPPPARFGAPPGTGSGYIPPPPGPGYVAPPPTGPSFAPPPGPLTVQSSGIMQAQYDQVDAQLRECEEYSAPSHFVRCSVNRLPASSHCKTKAHCPLGVVVQPLAPIPSGAPEVPTVNFASVGQVVRCKRCRNYVNPFMQWDSGGRRFICNLCQYNGEVPNAYYCHLDETGKRADRFERPELVSGSVEFIAPAEYMVRPPQPPVFMFLVETTAAAVASGLLESAVGAIKAAIAQQLLPGGQRCQVGLITFDSAVHFYNLSPTLQRPQMLVVTDTDDLFLPLPDEILVNVADSEAILLTLLDSLPEMFKDSRATESCLGQAVKAAHMSMKHLGGKLVVFAATIPTQGEGTGQVYIMSLQVTPRSF
jgi:protein transport protein SEC24